MILDNDVFVFSPYNNMRPLMFFLLAHNINAQGH